jgi:hypothetical protein
VILPASIYTRNQLLYDFVKGISVINQPTIFVAAFLAVLTLIIPRKYFLAPYVVAACFVPTDQRIIIMGMDFTVLRILVAVGIFRILLYGEKSRINWNRFDSLIVIWAVCGALIYIIQWMNTKALVNRLGALFDIIGLYWIFRQRIRCWNDLKLVTAIFAFSVLILMPLILLEWSTGHNPFTVLGRVITNVRGERYRCQAAFPHSIMMGLFWITLVPLFIGLGITENKKALYWAATIAAIFIVTASASSTPILVLAVVLVVLSAFKWRRYTAVASLCLVFLVFALHVVMKAPVWHLIARVNVIGGSTGWHRYNLINQAILHFDEWMFIGCRSTEHWGIGLGDVTNQFVLEGIRGGFVTLLVFLGMIYMALKILVKLSLQCKEYYEQFLIWCVFTAVISHCVAFLGVSYFGQITMLWYMTLAVVSLLAEYKLFLEKAAFDAAPANLSYVKPQFS